MKKYINSRTITITILCLLIGFVTALQISSIKQNEETDRVESLRLDSLREELITANNKYEDLEKRYNELRKQNREYENNKGNISEETAQLKGELDRVKLMAGLTDVKGDGIIINIKNTSVGFVTDSDLMNIVNDLKASDAQAISINDERVVALTEIRTAGEYIMVNGTQMRGDYEIKAISDPERLENSLRVLGGIVDELETYGIDVTITQKKDLIIKKVRDDGTVLKTDLLEVVED